MKINNNTRNYFLGIASSVNPQVLFKLSKKEQNALLQLFNSYDSPDLDISQKKLRELQKHLITPRTKQHKVNRNQALLETIDTCCKKHNIIPINPTFLALFRELPDKPSADLKHLEKMSEKEILNVAEAPFIEEVPSVESEGSDTYEEVLNELDRLKDKLGGSPNYNGKRPPAIDDVDKNKTFLGVPLSAAKDWMRKVLKEEWRPKNFWGFCAKKLFGITKESQETQYEYAAKSIQRFGILTKNKEQFLKILKENDPENYSIFNYATGLAGSARLFL